LRAHVQLSISGRYNFLQKRKFLTTQALTTKYPAEIAAISVKS